MGNSLVTNGFPSQRPVTWSCDLFFGLRPNKWLSKLEQLERLRPPVMWAAIVLLWCELPHDYPYYWPVHFESQVHTIDQNISDPKSKQGESRKTRKICEKFKFYNVFYKLNMATHPLMVVIICGKYGNNRSRTENVTERTQFSKSRSNDLEDIGQGQRSSHATHLLMLVIICTKYGKNPSRTVDPIKRTRFSRSRSKRPWKYRSRSKVMICNTPSHTSDHLC